MSTTDPITLPLLLPPDKTTRTSRSATPFTKLKEHYGMYSGTQIERISEQLPADNHLVEGLIPPSSVNLLVGDSGIGKSPVPYQIALAVAGGYQRFEPNPAMIANEEQERAFHQLPEAFTYAEASQTLGKVDESVNWFLHKLVRLGLASKIERGKYCKSVWCAREGIAA